MWSCLWGSDVFQLKKGRKSKTQQTVLTHVPSALLFKADFVQIFFFRCFLLFCLALICFCMRTSKAAVNKPYLSMNSRSLATAFERRTHSLSLLNLFSLPRFSKLNPLCWPEMQTSRKNASELWVVFRVRVLSMHKDGEARTKGDVESREIKASTEKAEQMEKKKYIYLFIEQQG